MNQFDVYTVELNPTKGSEMNKTRPAVIISPNAINKNLNTVIIAPLTSTLKDYPSRVRSNFQARAGQIALDQMRSVDKLRLKKKLGTVDKNTGERIKKVLQTMFS